MVESVASSIPLPPLRYRFLVGLLEESRFENPTGDLMLPEIPAENYKAVFDFGCGCGRLARILLQQKQRPERYLGIDINTRMLDWCKDNLTPFDHNFSFIHHDVFNPLLGQFNTKRLYAPFPCEDESFTLFLAYSVFTHLLPEQAEYYLAEMSRILRPGGIAYTSWFFCDKKEFPMMQDFQNALYINVEDPTNAVIYDRSYFETLLKANGLGIYKEETDFQHNVYLIKLGKPVTNSTSFPESALVQFQERPAIPRSMDNQPTDQNRVKLPQITSETNQELLAARIVNKDTNLIEPSLFINEMTPAVFDLENSGGSAWLTAKGDKNINPVLSQHPVRIQNIWEYLGPNNPKDEEELTSQPFYGKVFQNLPQSTPVMPGEVIRVPLLLYTPTEPGEYIFRLNMASGDKEWPGEPLYSQNVKIFNAPENTEQRIKRDNELYLSRLHKEVAKLNENLAASHQESTKLHGLYAEIQNQFIKTQKDYAKAHDAFTKLQQENENLKEAYKNLEIWAKNIEQELNKVPALIRKTTKFVNRKD